MSAFQKAERRQVKLKIGISGPSGSGKTFSALLLASGIGKRIAVIDTENGSASLYAGMDKGPLKGIAFDVLNLDAPYTIQKYNEAIEAAEKTGYDVLVIDGISPAWAGEGGLLAKKEALDNRGGNQNAYTNWASITKEHEIFKARLLNSDIHLVCSLRSKQDYILETNDKGKQAPKKVGMAPIQRDGIEYEFTVVFDLAMDHNAAASKDRTAMFDGQIFKITKKTGEQIMDWLRGGKPMEPKPAARPAPGAAPVPKTEQPDAPPADGDSFPEPATEAQQLHVGAGCDALSKLGISPTTIWSGISNQVKKLHGREVVDSGDLSTAEAQTVIDYLGRWADHLRDGKAKSAAKHAAADHAEMEA